MRFLLLSAALLAACDETTNPDPVDGGVVANDANAPGPPPDDAAIAAPIPFDAGTVPAPTCKGLFELCSGQECCSPNLCTNGTCR